MAKEQVKKAQAAKKAALKGTQSKKVKKVRTSTTFRLPKTLKLARNPKYARKSIPRTPAIDQYTIIKAPVHSDNAQRRLEEGNAITVLVDIRATKGQISEAFKKLYDVKPKKVNTLIRPDGQKKAFILMPADVDAQDIAAKLGIA